MNLYRPPDWTADDPTPSLLWKAVNFCIHTPRMAWLFYRYSGEPWRSIKDAWQVEWDGFFGDYNGWSEQK